MKKYLIKNIFYITIPLVLSYITSFLVNIDLPILIIIFYGILLFFFNSFRSIFGKYNGLQRESSESHLQTRK